MKLTKPKFWDYQKPNFLSYILLPFTLPLIINNFFLNSKKNIKKNSKDLQLKIRNLGNKILNLTLNEINFYINK